MIKFLSALLLTVCSSQVCFAVEDIFEDTMVEDYFGNGSLTIVILLIVLLTIAEKIYSFIKKRQQSK
jgi:hypothetical protein